MKFGPIVVLGLALVFFLPLPFSQGTYYPFDNLRVYAPRKVDRPVAAGHNPLINDPITAFTSALFYLNHRRYQEALHRGALAFWERSILGGMPLGNYFHPLDYVLFSVFPLTVAHDVFLFLCLTLAGYFMLLYLRQIGLALTASLFGAVAWMFTGYGMVWFEYEHMPLTTLCFAGIFYCVECLLAGHSRVHSLGLAILTHAFLCRAHLQFIPYIAIFVFAYILVRIPWEQADSKETAVRRVGSVFFRLSGPVLIAVLISWGFLYSNYQQLQGGNRTALSFDGIITTTGVFPFRSLLTTLFPDFFGKPTLRPWFYIVPCPDPRLKYNNFNELCVYCGVPTILLAMTGICSGAGDRRSRFFSLSALILLLMAGGAWLYYPVYALVPGMGFSTPTRLLLLVAFCICCLGALALQQLIEYPGAAHKKRLLAMTTVFIGLVACLVGFMQTTAGHDWAFRTARAETMQYRPLAEQHYGITGAAFAAPLVFQSLSILIIAGIVFAKNKPRRERLGGLLVGILAVDLMGFGWDYNTVSPRSLEYPETPAIRFLKDHSAGYRVASRHTPDNLYNGYAPYGIADCGGYASAYPRAYAEYFYVSQHPEQSGPLPASFSRWTSLDRMDSPLLDALGVKYIIFPTDPKLDPGQYPCVYSGEVFILENKRAMPKAYFVSGHITVKAHSERIQKLRSFTSRDFANRLILEKDVDVADREGTGDVTVTQYQSDEVTCSVRASCPGFVVVNDNFFPGWQATVDGRAVEILRANHTMRAVRVDSGNHIVTMSYRPVAQILGLLTSNLGALALGILLVTTWRAQLHSP